MHQSHESCTFGVAFVAKWWRWSNDQAESQKGMHWSSLYSVDQRSYMGQLICWANLGEIVHHTERKESWTRIGLGRLRHLIKRCLISTLRIRYDNID